VSRGLPRRPHRLGVPLLGLAVALAGTSGVLVHRTLHVRVPLLSAAVVVDADGRRVLVPPDGARPQVLPGTRALAGHTAAGGGTATGQGPAQLSWLGRGRVPGQGGPHADLVRDALLDLRVLTLDDGASVAGWPQPWRYVWPRDAAFVAAALARTGHPQDAVRVLAFLQRLDAPSGVFQARYLPDGTGVPDGRGEQTDGTGWVLWAAAELADTLDDAPRRRALRRLRPLVDRTTAAALRLTRGQGALPAPSPDYWEVHDPRLSLGTAAPLLAGLRAAARLQDALGRRDLAAACAARAVELATTVRDRFGRDDYPRYLGGGPRDASVAFLLPPFTAAAAEPDVLAAWRRAAAEMVRPAGGLAPGGGWKPDGISWTPQTALFALTAASTGDRGQAAGALSWLSRHRTGEGALPEKVLGDGSPAGPAPLAWTAALVVLTAAALDPHA
jgi:GH15 family glucan-1,4-alpha-glucosidase